MEAAWTRGGVRRGGGTDARWVGPVEATPVSRGGCSSSRSGVAAAAPARGVGMWQRLL